MPTLIALQYSSGVFHGYEFRPERIGGSEVGVAEVAEGDLDKFPLGNKFALAIDQKPDAQTDSLEGAEQTDSAQDGPDPEALAQSIKRKK